MDSSPRKQAPGDESADVLIRLKEFRPVDRGAWAEMPDTDWNDWRWQLKNRVTTLDQLREHLPNLTEEETDGARLANTKLAMAITPHYFNLIDPKNIECPIRRQVVPQIDETHTASWEMADPCGEDQHSPVPGLVHRYPDRVLFLVTDRCAAYCRYCTRSRMVSNAQDYNFHPAFEQGLQYLAEHKEVRDVLLSGGDPLLLTDQKLDYLLTRLREIPHLEFIRIGSRIPIFLPQRITEGLQNVFRKHGPIWMSLHTNHPREWTLELREA